MSDHARGEKLRSLREGRRLSQEDAAHEIGVSVRTLRSWEKGKGIKWSNAQTAARFYGVEPESLVDREIVEPSELDPDQLNRIEAKLDRLLGWAEGRTAEEVEDALVQGAAQTPRPAETPER